MDNNLGLWVLAVLGLAFTLGLAFYPRWQLRRRQALAAQPFPPAWRGILRRRLPLLARLPDNRRAQLYQRMQIFLAEVPVLGCAGLHVREDMRVLIAAQACLLLLGRPEPMFPGLRQVLLYPGSFMVARDRTDAAGVVHHTRVAHAGESWSEGQVVLSWEDARHGAAVPDDGYNVVLHEFAHQLAQSGLRVLSGPPGANDRPAPLAGPKAQAAWAATMQTEYNALCRRLEIRAATGQPEDDELLDPYAASAPEEFFAVATEVFFEQPQALRDRHPGLYAALQSGWGLDPAGW